VQERPRAFHQYVAPFAGAFPNPGDYDAIDQQWPFVTTAIRFPNNLTETVLPSPRRNFIGERYAQPPDHAVAALPVLPCREQGAVRREPSAVRAGMAAVASLQHRVS
jgi:hypothetical protein